MNDDTIYFAKTNFRGDERVFGIKNSDRRQHFYIIGKSGTGKTSLIANMVLQDILNGKGVAIIDPHGDVVEEIVERIPENRAKDTIYFNPADMDHPVGFNVLEVPDARYKHLIASDLMGIFTKIWANVWSSRMEYILTNCILALIDTPGTTLLGIQRILVDQNYRHKIIENVKDPVVKAFWVHEFEQWRDQFRNEAIVPIQNKVGQFLSTSLIRNIVGQPKSTLNINEVMNEGKILLVNVSKGRVGEDNSNLLGAMIITKIQLAAMERVRISEEERKDFYLYVDEFQNFVTDSFASILSEARKYRLNLIVAHQYIGQLAPGVSTKVRDAIFGNVGTMVAFRVGAADAEFLEKEFEPEFTIQDLVNLPNHNIYLKLMVNGVASRPFSAATLPPLTMAEKTVDKQIIIDESRRLYASRREDVEEQITSWAESEGGLLEGEGEKNQAICWVCGKDTEVKFKPEKGKPIYCQNCIKKLEKGEISPVFLPRSDRGRVKKFEPSLGKLGIEFPDDSVIKPPQTVRPFNSDSSPTTGAKDFKRIVPFAENRRENFQERKFNPPAPNIKEGGFVLSKKLEQGAEKISLSELGTKDVKPHVNLQNKRGKKIERSSKELAELRKTIEAALGKKTEEENKDEDKKFGSGEREPEKIHESVKEPKLNLAEETKKNEELNKDGDEPRNENFVNEDAEENLTAAKEDLEKLSVPEKKETAGKDIPEPPVLKEESSEDDFTKIFFGEEKEYDKEEVNLKNTAIKNENNSPKDKEGGIVLNSNKKTEEKILFRHKEPDEGKSENSARKEDDKKNEKKIIPGETIKLND